MGLFGLIIGAFATYQNGGPHGGFVMPDLGQIVKFLAITAVVLVAGAMLWPAISAGVGLIGLDGVAALMTGAAILGAISGGMQRALTNIDAGRPWTAQLGQAMLGGAMIGFVTAGLLGRLGLFDAELAGAGEEAVGGIEGGLSDLGAGDARVAVPEDVPAVEEPTGGGCSFAASTLVATPSGARSIGSLKVGDLVIAYNPTTGQSEAEPIQHVWLNHDHDLVDVGLHETATSSVSTTAAAVSATTPPAASTRIHRWLPPSLAHRVTGIATTVAIAATLVTAAPAHAATATTTPLAAHTETVHTTANHPWLTADRGWVAAGALQPGEAVVTLSGGTETVAWVHAVPGQAAMYNLTVANDHTYVVDDGHAVVHNVCVGPNTQPTSASTVDDGPNFTYRGDSRSPQDVFQNGFQPRGANTNLDAYVNGAPDTVYVGTSKLASIAEHEHALTGDFVYTTRVRSAIDINAAMGPGYQYAFEEEIASVGPIPPEDIFGAREKLGMGILGPFIPNPNFVP